MRLAALIAAALALTVTTAAAGVGPSLPNVAGAVTADEVGYAVSFRASTTTLSKRVEGRTSERVTLQGAWGLPIVTLTSWERGGLSPDGRTLVLGDNVRPTGELRARSDFAVVDTRTLALVRTISLPGEYSFDALSPTGRWLYLIRHVVSSDNRYQVKAYDLKAGRLLPGTIADKRQAGWLMTGYPVARVTSSDSRWVYTFYQQSDNYPFVHALDTVDRTAVCIGLPWDWEGQDAAIGKAQLTLADGKLVIASGAKRFAIDTRTLRLTR
jgi:hypothetical protein